MRAAIVHQRELRTDATSRTQRLERLKPALACPQCHQQLDYESDAATCRGCGARYPIRGGRIYFIELAERSDDLDRLKGWLKHRLGRAYYTVGIRILAPTFPFNFARRVSRYVDPSRELVVDAGSGNHRIHADIICADMFDYDVVDVVCSLDALPFRAASIGAFVSRSVIEHVPAPSTVVDEFDRCTRPGGYSIHMIPFLFPFHASPADYHRFTHEGQRILFSRWQHVETMNPTGPVTVALVVLLEAMATILSFNRPGPKSVIYLMLCGVLFPLKFLDAPFVDRRAFLGCAATILSVVRKPA
jgi:SAM-dependent methyltransferase